MLGLVSPALAASLRSAPAAVFAFSAPSLAHLTALDISVIAIYFVMVIWIGFYLKSKANTSEEFFMAGREMTAWIAGLSFVSANLGSLELMGWAGSASRWTPSRLPRIPTTFTTTSARRDGGLSACGRRFAVIRPG